MQEPSVLDYLKSKLFPWKYPAIQIGSGDLSITVTDEVNSSMESNDPNIHHIPTSKAPADDLIDKKDSNRETQTGVPWHESPSTEGQITDQKNKLLPAKFPWLITVSIGLALLGQASLGPAPERSWTTGVAFLVLAMICAAFSTWRGEYILEPSPPGEDHYDQARILPLDLVLGLSIALVAFISFASLQFTLINLALLLIALFFTIRAFWIPSPHPSWLQKIRWKIEQTHTITLQPQKTIQWLAKSFFVTVAIGIVVFFRFSSLDITPSEMNSDHAEKIIDITKVLDGQTNIFFPNNGGREPLHMYLAAGLHNLFNIPLGFDLLKFSTTLIGFLSLPFIYLVGKELGGKRIGFLAFLFAGIAYWPNVVSRVGLRLPFYLLFTASTVYFLLRGFRRGSVNDFILAGLSLGVSFYGYSADRILPVLVLLAFSLAFIHLKNKEKKAAYAVSFLAITLVSVVIFLPMARYMIAQPESFLYRTLSRVAGVEQPLIQTPMLVFLDNLVNALGMFSWSAGVIWPVSIPNYPALSVVSGAFFYLGVVLVFIRYIRKHNWQDLFLLLSIPVLLLPSILALAFPAENPNLYRTGGASIPVFLLVAMAIDGLITFIAGKFSKPKGYWIAWGLVVFLFIFNAIQDYDWVFNKYAQQYRYGAWNTSEMGKVVKEFSHISGTSDTIWVMGMPHWVDTRLVAIQAGFPMDDFALFVEQLPETQKDPRAKLFIVRPDDQQSIEALPIFYPNGWFQVYRSSVAETKNFLMFIVPANSNP